MGRSTYQHPVPQAHSVSGNNIESMVQHLAINQAQGGRLVSLYGEVTEDSIAFCINHLLGLANNNSLPITLLVSTYGGSIDEMFSLYDTIKFLPAPVHTVGLGKIMSAGTLILAAGEKGKRMIGHTSRVMLHSVSGGVFGNVFDMENDLVEIKRLQDMLTEFLSQETGQARDVIHNIMSSKTDHYLNAAEAVELGLADKVMTRKPPNV